MLVPLIISAVIAVGLLVLWLWARGQVGRLTAERDQLSADLDSTRSELARTGDQLTAAEERKAELSAQLDQARGDNAVLGQKVTGLTGEVTDLRGERDEARETLRKRTELADAQASQIDVLSAARDELQQKLTASEQQIATLAARPGVVVGSSDGASVDTNAATLWDLEVSRSERSWRNSVAINPEAETSPFDDTDDPVRTAVEIEAAALREDVGALITIDWDAAPIESLARRVLVVRVAQELLAQASRAPGAARLVARDGDPVDGTDGTDGADGPVDGEAAPTDEATVDRELIMTFEPADDNGPALNLIPPAVSTELIDISNDAILSLTVRAE